MQVEVILKDLEAEELQELLDGVQYKCSVQAFDQELRDCVKHDTDYGDIKGDKVLWKTLDYVRTQLYARLKDRELSIWE